MILMVLFFAVQTQFSRSCVLQGICEQVNNDLSTAEESAVKLLEIYRILNGSCEDLVKPGRIFQMELDVQFRHRHSQPDDLKKLHAYVFSDLLVLSKPTPTLRNKNRQKMFLCFYHHSLTLEKAPGRDKCQSLVNCARIVCI